MTEDYKKIAESIRNGKYFGDARGWFEAVYIGPISERTFFLIIAILAGFVALFGLMAVSQLLPLTKHEPILIRAGERPYETQKSLVQLAPHHAAPNPGISNFLLARYVQLRESFDSRTFTNDARFIQANSSADAYNAYVAAYNPASPQSPFAALGDLGQRLVSVDYVQRISGAPQGQDRAVVVFSTNTVGVTNPATTQWTATLDYIYTDLVTKTVKDPKTKELELEVTDPHFQVVNYVLQEQQ